MSEMGIRWFRSEGSVCKGLHAVLKDGILRGVIFRVASD